MSTGGWFNRELVQAQGALYGYAAALLGGSRDAWDVLQSANQVMCEKADDVAAPADFLPWAFTVVRFQVMAHRKRATRERHVFGLSVFEKVAAKAAEKQSQFADRIRALETCLQKLPERQRKYVSLRYDDRLPIREIAGRMDCSENTVALALHRARAALAGCINLAMGRGQL
jgi:RNA polymerase sigma-70 factor (ECF subfamily)